MTDFYVYALYRDEAKTNPFYIGKGRGRRLSDSVKERTSNNSMKNRAIAKRLRELGHVPHGYLARGLEEAAAFALETFWIQYYGRMDLKTGCLTNATNGGEGVSGWTVSPERRAAMSEANRLRMADPAERERCASNRGKKHTPETREKMCLAAKQRSAKPEWRAAISAANKARGAQISATAKVTHTGKVVSAETRKKMSISAKNKPKASKETIAKRRATFVDNPYVTSEETKKKISEAVKAGWARRKEQLNGDGKN